MVFSLSGLDPALKQAFEPHSPGRKRRLQAMETLANAGIMVGASLMPVIPFAGDDVPHLDEVVRAVKSCGGAFVLAGGLTMEGVQAERTLEAARRLDRPLEAQWRRLYGWEEGGKPGYGPRREYAARLGSTVRELCLRHGLKDRMPRHVAPGPLCANKRIAEKLFLRTYDLELEQADAYRIWAYRKAAWTIDELPESVSELFTARGEEGLRALAGIGWSLAGEIAGWLRCG